MSIVRRYRDATVDDGSRLFEYREAWSAPGSGEVTVHHGRVGAPGTVKDQTVADDAEAAELLEAFAAQCAEDGFVELDEAALQTVTVRYRLRGAAATEIERRHAKTLATEITHQLAWRGLGEVTDVADGDGELVLTVRTPHAAKAVREVPAAAKRAHGIQPNKVTAAPVRTGE